MNFDFNKLCVGIFEKTEEIKSDFEELLLSCSAGPDSTLLFYVFCEIAKTKKNFFKLRVVHFNYSLRGDESLEDERFITALSHQFHIPIDVIRIPYEESLVSSRVGMSLQEWARLKRRDYFAQYCSKNKQSRVVLAHHADDLVETLVMRMARGCGPASWIGMREWDGFYWRPFLEMNKANIIQILKSQQLDFRQDSSNDKMEYTRNIIRKKIIPELESIYPGCSERILNLARDVDDLAKFFEADTELSVESLKAFPNSLAMIKLKSFIHQKIGRELHVSRKNIEDVFQWILRNEKNSNRKSIQIRKAWRLEISKLGFIEVCREKEEDG